MRGFLLATLSLAFPLSREAAAMDVPLVSLTYSFGVDEACASREDVPLDPRAVAEVDGLMPELEAAWTADGPELLDAAREAVGRPFRFQQATARLVTCGIGSWSRPLTINVRPYLTTTAGRRRARLGQFASTVFHELLHRYVGDVMAERRWRDTPLLEKYAGEPQEVRDHLHLFAIEEVAYRATGREGDLRDVMAFERHLVNGRYFSRGRDLVRAEGAEAFVGELRQAP